MPKIVATNLAGYNQARNFFGHRIEGYRFIKRRDFANVINRAARIVLRRDIMPPIYCDFGLGRYDLLHFFNTLNVGSRPWVTTFEYVLPRGNDPLYFDFGLRRLQHPSCRKLIAMSSFALRSQQRLLDTKRYVGALADKLTVLHPPQMPLFDSVEAKRPIGDRIVFTLVGDDFFRKGGALVLSVFDALLQTGAPIRLNIVSRLSFGDYTSGSSAADQAAALAIFAKHDAIRHYSGIPNATVVNLLRDTDVGLLPTYEDTYGYSVLEAQAAGCPVITTNGGALPEINNDDCGWLIQVPLYENGRSVTRTDEAKANFRAAVTDQLTSIIRSIIADPDIVRMKGGKALSRIQALHDPVSHAARLGAIYDQALSG